MRDYQPSTQPTYHKHLFTKARTGGDWLDKVRIEQGEKGGAMTTRVYGVFRDGVFHPNRPVDLPENTPVFMVIDVVVPTPIPDDESEGDRERRRIHEILVEGGIVRPGPVPGPYKSTLSPEREEEIAQELAKIGRPVYDIIRKERDSN
jgi:hypothetical protein